MTHYQTLLTGAGFSHNFGLYLASQMWEHIFNRPEVHRSQPLKFIFERYFNYEEIIDIVTRDHPAELPALFSAMNGVYSDMDAILRKNLRGEVPTGINLHLLRDWLRSFSGEGKDDGYIFTLNHDLFFERFAGPDFRPAILGAPREAQCESVHRTNEVRPVAISRTVEFAISPLNVVKLHGSCNWLSEGSQLTMIVGGGKRKSIEASPLLSEYVKRFREVLKQTRLLWVVGYGFSDDHVNECIAEAVQSRGLKLAVVDILRPDRFYEGLDRNAGECAYFIRAGLRGYVPNSLGGIFQRNDNNSMPSLEMRRISRECFEHARGKSETNPLQSHFQKGTAE